MAQESNRRVVEALGIDTGSKDMRVLGAVLKAQREPTDFVGFEEVRRHLAVVEGGRKGKDPLIYRSLANLGTKGYLEVEKGERRHGYRSNTALIQNAIIGEAERRKRQIRARLQEIEAEIVSVRDLDYPRLAEGMIAIGLGSRKMDRTLFVQGWEDILRLVDDAVYRGLQAGDIVRITLAWVNQPAEVEARRLEGIGQIIRRGVAIRALEHRRNTAGTLNRYREILRRFRKQGYEPGFRVAPRDYNTYQFIARNEEGIVLVVSETPLSATWIPRTANPDLVDSAIRSFDTDFEDGVDVLEYGGD